MGGNNSFKAKNSLSVHAYRKELGLTPLNSQKAVPKPKTKPKVKTNKYRNVKTIINGITFDSKLEANRYIELKTLERGGLIKDLILQPQFPISLNNIKICKYISDFKYHDCNTNQEIIEDCKGVKTDIYRLKKKLLEAQYSITITEIYK